MEKLSEKITRLANSKPKSWYTKKRILELIKESKLFKTNNEFDQKRKEYSIKICQLLMEYFEKHPQIRFWQAISVIQSDVYKNQDMFYEEPEDTFLKLEKFLNE